MQEIVFAIIFGRVNKGKRDPKKSKEKKGRTKVHIKKRKQREPEKKVNSRREKQVSALKAYGFESSVSRHAVVRSGAAGDGELGLGRARPRPPIDGLGSTLDLSHVDPLVRLAKFA